MNDEEALASSFEEFRNKTSDAAEKIIEELLPNKILSLSKVHQQAREKRLQMKHVLLQEDFDGFLQDPAKIIQVNEEVKQVVDILKSEIVEMLAELNTIRLWVRLSVPKMEDGNNFGVEVQEEVLNMLNSLYNSGVTFLKNLAGYYLKRAKLLSDMRKRPHVKEYTAAVLDLDDKHYMHMAQSCCDLRNNYAFLHDKIMKNIEKIRKPKGNTNRSVMY